MTTYPHRTTPTTGLYLINGNWKAAYTVNGVRKTRGLGTTDLTEARRRQAKFYRELAACGAVEKPPRSYGKGERYIYPVAPSFLVKVRGEYVGNYGSMKEAKEARDEYLRKNQAP